MQEFREYKQAVPTYGAVLLNENMTHVSTNPDGPGIAFSPIDELELIFSHARPGY